VRFDAVTRIQGVVSVSGDATGWGLTMTRSDHVASDNA
jgi:hypothetical protein